MKSNDISEMIRDMRHQVIETIVYNSIPEQSYHDEWDVKTLVEDAKNHLGFEATINDWVKEDGIIEQEIILSLIHI